MTTLILLASVTAAGYAAYYSIVCVIDPWSRCRRCSGTGDLHSRLVSTLSRPCPRCDGTGIRVRTARRIYEYVRAEREQGTR